MLNGQEITKLFEVRRLGEEKGVQRLYDERHAESIASWMIEHPGLMPENMIVESDKRMKWDSRRKEVTIPGKLLVLDAQHRYMALKLFDVEDREQWQFEVRIYQPLSEEQRGEIFRLQVKRKKIHANMDLQLRAKMGQWRSATQQHAYEILELLAEDGPLKGCICLTEVVGPKPLCPKSRGEVRQFMAHSLMPWVQKAIGQRSSVMSHLPVEDRKANVVYMFVAAAYIWASRWKQVKNHMLFTITGMKVLLQLFVTPEIATFMEGDFSTRQFDRFFQAARNFKWQADVFEGHSCTDIEKAARRLAKLAVRNRTKV